MGNARQRAARKKLAQSGDGGEPNVVLKKQNSENHGAEVLESGKKKKISGPKKRKRNDEGENVGNDDGEVVQSVSNGSEKAESGDNLKGTGQGPKRAKDDKASKKTGSKHPLRVAGMRPGEGCFLCKGTDHIAKFCPTKSSADRKKMCLLCRRIGHTVKNCPSSFGGAEDGSSKFCYNCGESGHRLSECKQPLKDGGTAFAECFVCKQKGHLSKNCPSNPHGIYPKGGSCKLCGGVTHLAKDCPSKTAGQREKLKISVETAKASEPGENGKRIVFQSGDDLNDDFGDLDYGSDGDVADDQVDNRKVNSTKKSKKRTPKATPKVVKFKGSSLL
ncbi:zinc finger CCHC domain-containing protein 9 [Marchantia polymorpha subsp. ruderalis]|uniref:CCHC-type domain-containing protein n=2 Tax=Marchantia polymorpha TaxID=3197 RepID=A0AAF6AXV5_MARPO|nr:hypothetical protein MARPO_0006s0064 [Marchantia polymorpha]BBN04589.1 hypothetical protein Mp_3g05940 [Marchantia polymorpha subsp. ruderalis]|eukprot:PTQ48025.1 hypothetical protein MARPO_0006s0064 [Marchantia polymorpha]